MGRSYSYGSITGGYTFTLPNAKGDSTSEYTYKTATIHVNTGFGQSGVSEYSGNITQ